MKYRAWIPDSDVGPDDGFDVEASAFEEDGARSAAREAAEYHHRRRDGWEWGWPIVFAIRDEGGRVDYFEVELEMTPEFNPHQVREKPTRLEMRRG